MTDMLAPQGFPTTTTAAPGPAGDPFAAAPVAGPAAAPALQAAPVAMAAPQSFKVGSIVEMPDGTIAVVIAAELVDREVPVVDPTTMQPTGARQTVQVEGYRIATFAASIDLPHTAQELGLKAL